MKIQDAHVLEWMHKHVHMGTAQYRHPAYRDDRNCTVRALADALGIHLIDAYVLMRERGRKHGRGVYPNTTPATTATSRDSVATSTVSYAASTPTVTTAKR